MIAVDTNILVHAFRQEMPKHKAARRSLELLAEGVKAWAIPVFVVGEFFRIVTHISVFDPPTRIDRACKNIELLLASPSARLLLSGERYWPLRVKACQQADARGNLVFDAQIVALCLEHGVSQILNEDRDFRRFDASPLRTCHRLSTAVTEPGDWDRM